MGLFPAAGFAGLLLAAGFAGLLLAAGFAGLLLAGFNESSPAGLSPNGFSPNFRLPPSSFALWTSLFLGGVFPPCRSLIFRFLISVKGYKDTAK